MIKDRDIITVGISPSWDVLCFADGIEWGDHTDLKSQQIIPGGKALNITQALAWTETKNIAAGLWGKNDHAQLIQSLTLSKDFINLKLTQVPFAVRHNVTLIDEKNHKELHIKASNKLATLESLDQLARDLETIITNKSCVVLAGALPKDNLLQEKIIQIVETAAEKGAKIVVDTHGPALRKLIDTKKLCAIHVNTDELCELLECEIENTEDGIIKQAEKLLTKVEMVLVSRAKKGAIAITKNQIFRSACITEKTVNCTVGCGDYLLAGFLAKLQQSNDMGQAIENGIRLATAKAWNVIDKKWIDVKETIEVKTEQL